MPVSIGEKSHSWWMGVDSHGTSLLVALVAVIGRHGATWD